jgi:hypothetical protein
MTSRSITSSHAAATSLKEAERKLLHAQGLYRTAYTGDPIPRARSGTVDDFGSRLSASRRDGLQSHQSTPRFSSRSNTQPRGFRSESPAYITYTTVEEGPYYEDERRRRQATASSSGNPRRPTYSSHPAPSPRSNIEQTSREQPVKETPSSTRGSGRMSQPPLQRGPPERGSTKPRTRFGPGLQEIIENHPFKFGPQAQASVFGSKEHRSDRNRIPKTWGQFDEVPADNGRFGRKVPKPPSKQSRTASVSSSHHTVEAQPRGRRRTRPESRNT